MRKRNRYAGDQMKFGPDPSASAAWRKQNPTLRLRQAEYDKLVAHGLVRGVLRIDDLGKAAAVRHEYEYWEHVTSELKRLGMFYDWDNPPFIRLQNFQDETEVAEYCEINGI